MATSPGEFAKRRGFLQGDLHAFSYEQKVSVIQSILNGIPIDQGSSWVSQPNQEKRSGRESNVKITSANGETAHSNIEDVSADIFQAKKGKRLTQQDVPLQDPFQKSIKYYERHQIINHFQHMTAKLVLNRPASAIDYMISFCQEMQKASQAHTLVAKTLFEEGKIDIADEDDMKTVQSLHDENIGQVAPSMNDDQIKGKNWVHERGEALTVKGDISRHSGTLAEKLVMDETTAVGSLDSVVNQRISTVAVAGAAAKDGLDNDDSNQDLAADLGMNSGQERYSDEEMNDNAVSLSPNSSFDLSSASSSRSSS